MKAWLLLAIASVPPAPVIGEREVLRNVNPRF